MFDGPFDVTDDTIEIDGLGPLPKVTVDRMDDVVHVSQPESIQIGSDWLPGPSFEIPIEGREVKTEHSTDYENDPRMTE
jgi:hypothetical protein